MDFTISTYSALIKTLQQQGFSFLTFKEFISESLGKAIVLRHDVDTLPGNSLEFAKIQADAGIKGTYYFRILPQSFDVKIIKEISSLGHEVGYHYEDLSFAWTKLKAQGAACPTERRQSFGLGRRAQGEEFEIELVEKGIESFSKNLEKLRKIVPVKTICMHGSPMSRWDSRLLWKYYDYHDFGIIGEPYFDVNFDEVLYLTDTGRRWDGESFNIRDKASGVGQQATGDENRHEVRDLRHGETQKLHSAHSTPRSLHPEPFPHFHSTFDIIKASGQGRLPDKIMMTFHPQRWSDKILPWAGELIMQNLKNIAKYFIIRINS